MYIYIYVRNPKSVATPVRIYTYTDFAIETWDFYRRLQLVKDTLRISPRAVHGLPVCWAVLASISRHVYQIGEMLILVEVVRCFWRVLENDDCRTKFSSSLGMEYNGELCGFSAVKAKLVDSLI